ERTAGLRQLDTEWTPGPVDSQDVVAMPWRWKRQSTMVVGMHPTSSIGIRGESQSKMAMLAAIARGHSGPWAAIGGWNAVTTPEGVSDAWTRNPARILDYVVCSGFFLLALDKVNAGPGTTAGFSYTYAETQRSQVALQRCLLLPQPFQLPDMPKRKADPNSKRSRKKAQEQHNSDFSEGPRRDDLFGECEPSVEDGEVGHYGADEEDVDPKRTAEEVFDLEGGKQNELWQLKLDRAQAEDRKAWRTPPSHATATAAYLFDPYGKNEMGAQCGAWVHAVEQYYCATLKIEAAERRNFSGRADEMRFKVGKARLGYNVSSDLDQSVRCEGRGMRAARLRTLCKDMSATIPSGGIVKMTSKQRRRWREALNSVEAMSEGQISSFGQRSLAGYTNWEQEQEAAGCGKLHKTTKDKPRCDNEVRSNGSTASSMIDYMDAKGAQWSRKWKSSFSREEDWAPITIESLNNAIDTMAKSKDAGGDRAIGLLPEVVKLWSKMRSEYTHECVTSMAGKWGAATAGNSALREALLRSFADAVPERPPTKVCTVTALWDRAEFCDTREPVPVLDEGLGRGMPARTVRLEMPSRSGARFIGERTACAEPTAPNRSACADARRGIDFGRVALHAVLEKVSAKVQQMYVRSWVDDVATRMEGSRKQ
ncbi:unnamed protein product, partial [Prorocentrum cordatum]